ncbi:MAG: DNA mismatch repair protein MutS, partial [Fuerstia sp.]|nr:DNA mismatch repair protein MutS [Fuerstiella sp.]
AQPMPWWIVAWSLLIGLIAIPVIALVLTDMLPLKALLTVILLQAPAIALTRRQIRAVAQQMDNVDSALRQFGAVIGVFERHSVEESAIRDLQNRFHSESETASQAIRRLGQLTQWLNNATRNQFFAPIAWACGLFVLLTFLLERWRLKHGRDVADWLETTACLEASLSVAGYSFDHPDDCLPVISDTHPELIAEELGHPLLRESACVRNSVSLTSERPLLLISGSNMSGKSTFLRSLGASVVLTLCGSVVRAKSFRTYPFQVATAMRVSDSLQEGRSLFFTVVRRLKTVVDLTEQPRIVLFLLDEILNGTNSHDRRRGAEAVIRSLIARHALGIVTTHDLALTQIADSMSDQAVNKHFEDKITDGQMTFDYTLRDGVVERSNAIALMRMLGLDV